MFFLYSFPERLQRGRLLNLLHQLRSTAHIIDMHQLSKDPEQLRPSFVPTPVSKPLELTRDEMERYLDYCSELLALVGKTAALCAEESRDYVVLETVSTVETLTVGISRKIWQKISNLPRRKGGAAAGRQPSRSSIPSCARHATEVGSITTKWSPSTSTSSASAPAPTAAPT